MSSRAADCERGKKKNNDEYDSNNNYEFNE
jgi:hypothetical protein